MIDGDNEPEKHEESRVSDGDILFVSFAKCNCWLNLHHSKDFK